MNGTRLARIRDDLHAAMLSREVAPRGGELYELACELVVAAHPECPAPRSLDAFSLLVGFAAGSAVQKLEDGS